MIAYKNVDDRELLLQSVCSLIAIPELDVNFIPKFKQPFTPLYTAIDGGHYKVRTSHRIYSGKQDEKLSSETLIELRVVTLFTWSQTLPGQKCCVVTQNYLATHLVTIDLLLIWFPFPLIVCSALHNSL